MPFHADRRNLLRSRDFRVLPPLGGGPNLSCRGRSRRLGRTLNAAAKDRTG